MWPPMAWLPLHLSYRCRLLWTLRSMHSTVQVAHSVRITVCSSVIRFCRHIHQKNRTIALDTMQDSDKEAGCIHDLGWVHKALLQIGTVHALSLSDCSVLMLQTQMCPQISGSPCAIYGDHHHADVACCIAALPSCPAETHAAVCLQHVLPGIHMLLGLAESVKCYCPRQYYN